VNLNNNAMSGLSEIIAESFHTSFKQTFGNIRQWIGLAILMFLTFGFFSFLFEWFNFPHVELESGLGITLLVLGILFLIFFNGIYVKFILREDRYFSRFGMTFIDGLKFTLVEILYTIIPIVLAGILRFAFITGLQFLTSGEHVIIYNIGIIIAILLIGFIAIFFTLFWLPAMNAFAQTKKISTAFKFRTLDEMIQIIGWKKFLLGYLIWIGFQVLIFAVFIALSYLLFLIPVVGGVLGLVLFAVLSPFICIFAGDFISRLFEGDQE